MTRAFLLAFTLAAAACSFHPLINPLEVKCKGDNADSCPEGYVCGNAGLCCADFDESGTCDGVAPQPDADLPEAGPPEAGPPDTARPEVDGGEDTALDAPADTVDAPADMVDAPDVSAPEGLPEAGPEAGSEAGREAGMPEVPMTCDNCAAGSKACSENYELRSCVEVSPGCTVWQQAPCTGRRRCEGGPDNPHCECAGNDCSPKKTTGWLCDVGAVYRCEVDTDGCGYIAEIVPCPTVQTCVGDFPNGACSCTMTPPAICAGTPGAYCESGKVLVTCGTDPHGCFGVTNRVACAGGTCNGTAGTASCNCPHGPSSVCPGVGRVCRDGALVNCRLDADGCITPDAPVACGGGRTCQGDFASADCRCAPGNTSCGTLQTAGWPMDFGKTVLRYEDQLFAYAIDIPGAFKPVDFFSHTRAYSTPSPQPRFIEQALYSSDANGEPDRLVASTVPRVRSDHLDTPLQIPAQVLVLPRVLPSGRYWLAAAFSAPTLMLEDTIGEPVPIRMVGHHVDVDTDSPLPDPFSLYGPPTASTGRPQKFWMTISPQ